ncbi:hypothetical protein [Polaribacter sp. Hel1_85]|uniref:hypothetical protein n=1 Tax=Polaribacter sp. Hel1_85 TaxID=1250005 RepID=UPI00052B6C58|nr:hypothetical protein [Polaribacter sp. Hel1_85]KGL62414.1 hypothetical protein PHEL85_2208 [Polaribacter sp. Hel1_85]
MKQIASFLILLVSISAFSQGPWTQEKGKFYTQFSFSTIPSYDELFGDPDYNPQRNITDNTFQFYGEYGISNKTTLLINVPLKMIKTGDLIPFFAPAIPNPNYKIYNSDKEISLGNIEIGIKHNFYKKDWLLSGQFSIETNTSTFDVNSGIRTGYDAFTFTPLFIAGKSFNKGYLQTFIGSKIRTNNYSSNFKIGGEYGTKITKNIWLVGFVDIEKSFKNGNINLPASNLATGLYVNDQEYGVVGVKAIGEFSDNFGMTASLPAAFFGNNVAKQVALSVGIYKKF